jgi:hypothetical protein
LIHHAAPAAIRSGKLGITAGGFLRNKNDEAFAAIAKDTNGRGI